MNNDEITFAILGNPIPKERPRVTIQPGRRAYAYTPKRTRHWEATVRDAARVAMCNREPFTGPVAVELWIWRGDKRRADGDNCEKAVVDACNEVVWLDDDQIVEMHRYKRLDRENPRAEMRVWGVEEVDK